MKTYRFKYVVGHAYNKGSVTNVYEHKDFATQRELFDYLVANKADIIEHRKSIDKHCDGGISLMINEPIVTDKSALYENNKEDGTLKRTILANTYWWMDSQDDVLLGSAADGEDAIFTKSIKSALSSRKGAAKVPPMDQHNYSFEGRIGKTLNLYEAPISWRALGVGRTGMTQGLFADVQIEKSKNEQRYMDYLNNEVDQHSVGMRIIDMELAINDPEQPKEKAVFDRYIGKIGNRQQVESQGYFFAINEGSLREYSAVIAGANELTPVIGQPSGDAGKIDVTSGDTINQAILSGITKLIYQTI